MENRLYVSNLSAGASLTSLRECFARCGEVTEVEFSAERYAHRSQSSAFVTMATSEEASEAVRVLNGTLLDGRLLQVTVVPGPNSDEKRTERREAKKAAAAAATIAQQYRERHNMTYELDCQGSRLLLRIFFPPETGQTEWRIEARSSGDGGIVIDKAAPTRALALQEVSAAWQALAPNAALPEVDWPAVTLAMQGVRAI